MLVAGVLRHYVKKRLTLRLYIKRLRERKTLRLRLCIYANNAKPNVL